MASLPIVFHHYGLATSNHAQSVHLLQAMGYSCSPPIYDDLQKVHLSMCLHTTLPPVEVVSPGGEDGPLDNILKSNQAAVYHLCFVVQSFDEALAALGEHTRLRCVSEPKEVILFDGLKVAFYYLAGLGLIELLQDPAMRPDPRRRVDTAVGTGPDTR